MKFAKEIITILCDDIRDEEGNKRSLMGVYPRDYVVPKVDILVPKLCLAVFVNGIKDLIPQIKVTFYNPGFDPAVMHMKAPPLPDVKSGEKNFNLGIIISPFRIKECGEARFELDFGIKGSPKVIHRFTIKTPNEASTP